MSDDGNITPLDRKAKDQGRFAVDSKLIARAAHIANGFDFDIYWSGEE